MKIKNFKIPCISQNTIVILRQKLEVKQILKVSCIQNSLKVKMFIISNNFVCFLLLLFTWSFLDRLQNKIEILTESKWSYLHWMEIQKVQFNLDHKWAYQEVNIFNGCFYSCFNKALQKQCCIKESCKFKVLISKYTYFQSYNLRDLQVNTKNFCNKC